MGGERALPSWHGDIRKFMGLFILEKSTPWDVLDSKRRGETKASDDSKL